MTAVLARRAAFIECRYRGKVVIHAVAHKIRCHCQSTLSMRNVAFVLFCATISGFAQGPQPAPTPSIIYAIHDSNAIKDYKMNPPIVYAMVNWLDIAATGLQYVA